MENQPNNSQQIQIKVTDEVLKGVYANMAQIAHTPEEFILDFMNIFPPSGIITSRVIISPGHMKRIAAAILENIKSYEKQYGSIKDFAGQATPTTTSTSDSKFGFDTTSAK